MARRAVDPQQSFPALEQEVLARWRERDVFRESIRRREGAEPWVFYEGPPTANGRPGSHHVLARVFKDIYPRYKTMRGYYVERKGGWDCHGLPVEIAVEQQLGHREQARDRGLRDRRVQPALPRVGLRVPGGLERADRAHRLLDRPRRRLPHARPDLHRVGLVGAAPDRATRACSTRATRSCPTARAAARRSPATRWRRATRPSSTRASTCACPVVEDGGPLQAGDELLVWTTTPWTLVSNAAVAVDPELTYVRAKAGPLDAPGRARRGARRARARHDERRDPRPLPGRGARRRALRAAVRASSRPTPTASAATPCCSPTSSPPTTAPASCTPRSPSARTTSASARSTA